MAVVRVRPRVALIDDEVDVDDVQRLAEPFEQVEGVGVAANEEVTEIYLPGEPGCFLY